MTTEKPDFFSAQVLQARRFYLDLKSASQKPLVVICGGVEHCAVDYKVSRESFPFYSIEFVVQGAGQLKLNGSEYRLQPGSVFAYGPGISQNILTHSPNRLVKYFVDFSGTNAVKLLKKYQLKPGTVSQVFPPAEIQPLFDELIRTGLRSTGWSSEICAKILEVLLLKILDARSPLPGQDTLAFATYQQCRSHIDQDFLRLRSLEQIAEECHVDAAYLCRLFQRFDQQTPYRILTRLKMNYAAEQLQSPGVLVKQIAEKTGFTNPFHFSKTFKSIFGVSPKSMGKMR